MDNNVGDDENIGLIDILLEDDFLIDRHLDDNSSLDLRLSVAFENQMELLCDIKIRPPLQTCRLKRECGDNNDNNNNVRNSLAWDTAFFTSPGFLELEELCLVNRAFKDPQRQSLSFPFSGGLDTVRRKVCLERNSGHKAGLPATRRQNTHPLMKAKLPAPTKMVGMQDSQRQLMTSRQSETFRGETSKSQVITGKKDYLKSGKATTQIRLSTAENKKSPLQGLRKNGKTKTPERPGSAVSSSLPHFSFTATNPSLDLSPYRSKDSSARTVTLAKSQEIKGECFPRSHSPISVDRQNKDRTPQERRKVISGRGLQRQSATRSATKTPFSANTHWSPNPSEKRDYYDMNAGAPIVDEAHINCGEKLATRPTTELKNRQDDVKSKTTPSMLQERKGHTKNKADIYQESVEIISPDENVIEPSDREHRRRNHVVIVNNSKEKENMVLSEDTVIEFEPKQRSPLPHQLGTNASSITSKMSNSSRKPAITVQRPTAKINRSPIGTRKPF